MPGLCSLSKLRQLRLSKARIHVLIGCLREAECCEGNELKVNLTEKSYMFSRTGVTLDLPEDAASEQHQCFFLPIGTPKHPGAWRQESSKGSLIS